MLSVKDIHKSYQVGKTTYEVLKGISLQVEKGEFVAVMGPSGSGKTTLLNCISCYIPLDSGSIVLGDMELAKLGEDALAQIRNQQLGFVFQDFLLLDGLTVRKNILLPAIIGGNINSQVEERANQLCHVFGIDHIRDKYPAEISGGEKQRTAVARALINHPLLILADEPTGNLDSKSSRAVIRSFEQAKTSLEATIFMVTHDSFAASFSAYGFASRPVDFEYHWRSDQDLPKQSEVVSLASEYGVELTSWAQVGAATLGSDGTISIEQDNGAMGTTYTEVYQEVASGATFFSESAWNALTGQNINIAPGTCANVLDDEGSSTYLSGGDVTLVTNTLTGESLSVRPAEPSNYTMLLGTYVLDDGDYNTITTGLTDLWQETWVFFNVADVDSSYPFAKALFNKIVDRSGDEVMQLDAYDLAAKMLAEAAGESYDFDRENIAAYGFPVMQRENRDSTEFRNYWLYMPQFRVLDQNDFVTTMAVFLMLFIFISLICFAAVIVIAFTRCMTIALTNTHVYDDLRHLGAPKPYLFRSVKGQVSKVFLVPAIVGTLIIAAFYTMIMYFNDNRFTSGELAGMGACAVVVAALSLLLYGVYRFTRKRVCRSLGI